MSTLYLRNVPDEVVDRLERLAKRESLSVSALAVRELAEASRRVDNSSLLNSLPTLGTTTDDIVNDLEAAREEQ